MATNETYRVPVIARETYGSPVAERLEQIWKTRPGFLGWLSSVDHKQIGRR